MNVVRKFADENGITRLWEKIKEYVNGGEDDPDYKFIEYIVSTSKNAYIDTGLTLNSDYDITVEGCTTTFGTAIFYDSYYSQNIRTGCIVYNSADPRLARWWTGAGYARFETPGVDLSQRFSLKQNKKGITLRQNGVVLTGSYSGTSGTSDTPLLLFSTQNTAITQDYAKMYSMLVSLNGRKLREFKPAIRRSDDAIGMLDEINDVFYPTSGSEDFIAGPEIKHGYDAGIGISIEHNIISFDAEDAGVQSKLVSGTNIKTINNTSLLGSGDISVGGDTNVQSDWNESDSTSDAYIANKPTIPTVPTNVSAFTNDAGYLTSFTETDPTVPSWAKASTKPSYTASEVGALPDTTTIPSLPSDIHITADTTDLTAGTSPLTTGYIYLVYE